MKKYSISFIFLLFILFVSDAIQAKDNFVLKFATIAPEGTTWMNTMKEMNEEIVTESNGRLKIRFYPGGIMGDELVVLRKMRINQIHGAGFSGVGLGEVMQDVRILDLPYLFHSNEEADYVHNQMFSYFHDAFAEQGYELLGWAEVGFVRFFSQKKIERVDDLKQIKLWVWQDDPVAQALFQAMQISTIPLAVTDVLTSLQVGMIDTVYSPPLGALALQWYTKVDYMSSFPITHSTGAVLVSKRFFDSLPPDLQTLLQDKFKKYLELLVERSRTDNQQAISTLQDNGVEVITPSDQNMDAIAQAAQNARNKLVGSMFPQDLYDRIKTLLDEYRNQSQN